MKKKTKKYYLVPTVSSENLLFNVMDSKGGLLRTEGKFGMKPPFHGVPGLAHIAQFMDECGLWKEGVRVYAYMGYNYMEYPGTDSCLMFLYGRGRVKRVRGEQVQLLQDWMSTYRKKYTSCRITNPDGVVLKHIDPSMNRE